MKVRELTANDIEFFLECYPEEAPIEGNCSALDADSDRLAEQWIYDQLWQGNSWAWCTAIVTARWGDFVAGDSLGCCSYESEEAFRQGSYFEDMKELALDRLNQKVQRAALHLDELAT